MKDFIFDEQDDLDEQVTPVEQPKKSYKKNILGIGILSFVIITAGAVLYSKQLKGIIAINNGDATVVTQVASSSPDAILLTVNGTPITRKIYSLSINNILQLAESQKLDTSSKTIQEQVQNLALANVVNTELLAQKAKQEGYKIDEDKINESIKSIAEKAGNETKLADALRQLGMTLDELKRAIGNELLATEFISRAVRADQITVTDSELKQYYAATKAKATEGSRVPEYKDMQSRLKEELLQEKQQQQIEAYLADLRKVAKIEIIKY